MKGVGTDEAMLTRVIVGNRDRLNEIKSVRLLFNLLLFTYTILILY